MDTRQLGTSGTAANAKPAPVDHLKQCYGAYEMGRHFHELELRQNEVNYGYNLTLDKPIKCYQTYHTMKLFAKHFSKEMFLNLDRLPFRPSFELWYHFDS